MTAEPTLGSRAARGALVTIAAQGARIVLQLCSVVVLARLLSPHDYGLIAMVLALVGVGEILRDFGLSTAAVQAPTLTHTERSTLLWLNTGIGALIALTVFLCAPLIASFYGEPELTTIARALSATFLINGATTQYRATLVRDLRFAALARTDIAAAGIGLVVAVVAALFGAGYWALVAQQLASTGAVLVLVAGAARWVPALPWHGASTRRFVRFGGGVVLSQLIGYVSNNVDSVIIGTRFGAPALGLYSRAFHLLMTPLNQVRSPLTSVALPVLSRLSEDAARFSRFVVLGQLAIGYSLVVGLAWVAGTAEPLTTVLLGEQWTAAAPILRLLAIAAVFQTLAFVGYWVYLARGLTGNLVRYSLVSAVIRIAAIFIGSQWGVLGVAVGYAIAPAIAWPISLWWLSRFTALPTRELYAGAGRVLVGVAFSASAAFAVSNAVDAAGPVAQSSLGLVAVAASYGVLFAIPLFRRDLARVWSLVRVLRSRVAG